MPDTRLRIGELSKRSGVSPELLRAWERRYGLLEPVRTSGGLRLYSLDDLERVRLMQQHLAAGLAAAEAAAQVAQEAHGLEAVAPAFSADAARAELAAAIQRFDEAEAQAVIDRVLAAVTSDALLVDVLLPYLHELGERWRRGETSIGEEHFASSIIRGRMLGLSRGWGRGLGPVALLACLPGEQHELGLIAFGLALRARGWRVAYLGGDTPIEEIERASENDPDLIVLSAVTPRRIRPLEARIRALAKHRRVALGGAGTREDDASALGVVALTGDPVSEAERVTAEWVPL
ncbi:MAG TPA: MerR family transcriptional regulator [Gaiellaceae bacterium]|nr:MerR family transcriptional regulator [Gaiellaceae bacterium]